MLVFSLTFRIVITIFIIISILLIYSLLMIGIDAKTLEIGIMRMVGISKKGLILMIFLQSIMFVIPAIIFGFALSVPLLAVCYIYVFNEELSNGFTPIPTGMAFLYAFSVGIFIPMLSAIIPVMNVLGQNLNDALNYERNRVKSIYIEILNKNKANIIPQVIFGVISVAYGITIYYLLPLSMLSMDLGMVLQVFFCILLSLLVGLCLLAVNLQKPMEVLLTYILLIFETRSMRRMVLNNFKAHTMRNRLTSTIFSMALGFIIFLLVSYKLQIKQVKVNQLKDMGSYPFLRVEDRVSILKPKDVEPVLKNNSHLIEDFTWISQPLRFNSYSSDIAEDHIGANHRHQNFWVRTMGIIPSCFEVAGDTFLDVYYTNSGLKLGE